MYTQSPDSKNVKGIKLEILIDEENLTESEFFIRELGAELRLIDPNKQVDFSETMQIWIASTRPNNWKRLIDESPKNFINFFFLGNELYNVNELKYLTESSSIQSIFLYSPRINPSIGNLLSALIGATLDSGHKNIADLKTYIRNFRTGIEVFRRLNHNSKLYKNVIQIPQGYSSSFVAQLMNEYPNFSPKQSIIDSVPKIDSTRKLETRTYDFGFVGQSGNLRRQRFLEVAANFPNSESIIIIRKGFGGNKKNVDDLYLKSSLESRFVLVPPGVFNNYNHRYCESLILGRLPIVVCNNQTDPNSTYYWVKSYSFLFRNSVKHILKRVIAMSDDKIAQIIDASRQVEFGKILEFRRKVQELESGAETA